MNAWPPEPVICDLCYSTKVSRIWEEHSRMCPVIFRCDNPLCARYEFAVMRVKGQIRYVSVPLEFQPPAPRFFRNGLPLSGSLRAATNIAHRDRVMASLPLWLRRALDEWRVVGVEHV